MMLVDVKVALAGDVEVYVTMTRYLFEHVVKETKTGADVALAVAIQADAHLNVRLVCGSDYRGSAVASKEYLCYARPRHVLAYYQALAAKVLCQLCICLSIAYYIRVLHIHLFAIHVGGEHGSTRFASGQILVRKRAVYMLGGELYALALEDVKHQIVRRPEVCFGIRRRTQPILIADKHQFVVGMAHEERQCTYGTRQELKLLERVYLFVLWLAQYGAVSVYEKYPLLHRYLGSFCGNE